jgi:hypothetical protein
MYENTLDLLSSHGFVVAAIRSGLDFAPNLRDAISRAALYLKDVADALAWLSSNASRSSSVDPRGGVGLFAHAMPCGALPAAARAGVAAVLSVSPSLCLGADDAAAAAADLNSTQLMFLSGSREDDALVTSRLLLSSSPSGSLLAVLKRGSGCSTELPTNAFNSGCGLALPAVEQPIAACEASASCPVLRDSAQAAREGAVAGLPRARLSQDAQLAVLRRLAALFFEATLQDDADAHRMLFSKDLSERDLLFADAMLSELAIT